MSDPNDDLGMGGLGMGGGGLPPLSPLGGPSLEAEEKAMKSGKGRMLAVMILAVIVAVGGLVLYMASGGGEGEAYSTFGRNVNGLKRDHFDTFWGCALSGTSLDDFHTNEDIAAGIHQRAINGKTAYARHLRDDCMPYLADLEPRLTTLIPPDDLAEKLRELAGSVGALRSAVSAYVAYIEGLNDEAYDQGSARTQVTAIARGWYDYKRIHNEINRAVAAKLER